MGGTLRFAPHSRARNGLHRAHVPFRRAIPVVKNAVARYTHFARQRGSLTSEQSHGLADLFASLKSGSTKHALSEVQGGEGEDGRFRVRRLAAKQDTKNAFDTEAECVHTDSHRLTIGTPETLVLRGIAVVGAEGGEKAQNGG